MSPQSNPFRVDDEPGEDTRYLVRSVLLFMSQAFEALEQSNSQGNNGAMLGAASILGACAAALKEADSPAVENIVGSRKGAHDER